MKQPLYPLKFFEIYKEKVWGGKRLSTQLNKRISPGSRIGESWEIAHRPGNISRIRNGPLKDQTISSLMEEDREGLLGTKVSPSLGRFPLLFKYVDAEDVLSLQVHPDDRLAKKFGEEDPGKTEAWIVLHASPGATLIVGRSPGTTLERMAEGLKEGNIEGLVRRWPTAAGDVFYLPSGTIHALGAGVLVSEIQQNSDLTYRLFDWNRMGLDGKPRTLHLEKGLKAINWRREKGGKKNPLWIPSSPFPRELLVECPYFHIERLVLKGDSTEQTKGERFHLLAVLEGNGEIACAGKGKEVPFAKGETILIPASLMKYRLESSSGCLLVQAWIP